MRPLIFEPYLRPQIWGDRKLETILGKNLPVSDESYGESWELSAHPHHISVCNHPDLGLITLQELWNKNRKGLVGEKYSSEPCFPWLIKYLSCGPTLSVQVHPNDLQAQEMLGEPRGKSEVWVILDSPSEGKVYAGFKEPVTPETFLKLMAENRLEECLHAFRPEAGDCIYIPAGTIHATGGGLLFAEVQQTSDATFRVHDWGRVDKNGKPRQLHVEQAMKVIDFNQGPVAPCVPVLLKSNSNFLQEKLLSTDYFELERWTGNGSITRNNYSNMVVFMVLKGSSQLKYQTPAGHEQKNCKQGDTILIPADCSSFELDFSQATILAVK